MKRFLSLFCLTVICVTGFSQGYTRSQLKAIWDNRQFPSKIGIDTTFNSLWVKKSDGIPAYVFDSTTVIRMGVGDTVTALKNEFVLVSYDVQGDSTSKGGGIEVFVNFSGDVYTPVGIAYFTTVKPQAFDNGGTITFFVPKNRKFTVTQLNSTTEISTDLSLVIAY